MLERWKDIPGYEGLYQVSNKGRVRSSDTYRRGRSGSTRVCKGRILKFRFNSGGYPSVVLYKSGHSETTSIHRLVMLAFVGPSRLHVNHRDGDKTNNHLGNLEYCTIVENNKHAARNGLTAKGEKHGNSKLTESQVKEIRRLYARGGVTQKEISRLFGVSRPNIAEIVHGRTWKHVR